MTPPPPYETTVRTDAQLLAVWRRIMGPGGFGRSSCWTIFFDDEHRLLPLIVPVDDIPREPDGVERNWARVVGDLVARGDCATAAIALSRPGRGHITRADAAWARALRAALGPTLLPWPVHLATADRVQVIPVELAAAS